MDAAGLLNKAEVTKIIENYIPTATKDDMYFMLRRIEREVQLIVFERVRDGYAEKMNLLRRV